MLFILQRPSLYTGSSGPSQLLLCWQRGWPWTLPLPAFQKRIITQWINQINLGEDLHNKKLAMFS